MSSSNEIDFKEHVTGRVAGVCELSDIVVVRERNTNDLKGELKKSRHTEGALGDHDNNPVRALSWARAVPRNKRQTPQARATREEPSPALRATRIREDTTQDQLEH